MTRRAGAAVLVALLGAGGSGTTRSPGPDLVHVRPNDNRIPAGELANGVLTIHLEVRRGVWHPEGPAGDSVTAAVFAEEGKAPQVPGPLIRVPAGTVIEATVRNRLPDSAITVHGLATRPATRDDGLRIPPGEVRTMRFAAGDPGTYLYAARAGAVDTTIEREQLAGALVIDSVGARADDRIFVINIWGEPSRADTTIYRNALTINGLSWPHTERITATVGDTARWRWINASARVHPMHLHGFYFRVEAAGDALRDTAFAGDRRPIEVTRRMDPGTTMRISWSPDRPGNWLFHCHIGFHVVPDARLDPPSKHHADRSAHDPGVHMAGLILGISVPEPPGWKDPGRPNPRKIRLFVQEGKQRFEAPRALGFVMQRGARPPAPDSVEIPGTVLVLTQNQPTDITVINRLKEAAAIHWHGIELESYSDGVPGWSGLDDHLAPSIEPGASFTARLTLPRPGTFIYHTHMNDIEQISSGLYGAIVVLPPGQTFDSTRDHVYVVGWDGTSGKRLVNGNNHPPPLTLSAGVAHRFRFVGIGAANGALFGIVRDTTPVVWRAVARDGADLLPAQAVAGPARQYVNVGETFDAEWIPEPGEYTLYAGRFMTQRLIVK